MLLWPFANFLQCKDVDNASKQQSMVIKKKQLRKFIVEVQHTLCHFRGLLIKSSVYPAVLCHSPATPGVCNGSQSPETYS